MVSSSGYASEMYILQAGTMILHLHSPEKDVNVKKHIVLNGMENILPMEAVNIHETFPKFCVRNRCLNIF